MKSRHNDTITSSSRSSSSSHHKHASLLLFVSPFFFLFFSSFSFPFVCIISVILTASPSIPTPFPPSLCFCVPHRHYTCIEIKSTATKTKKNGFHNIVWGASFTYAPSGSPFHLLVLLPCFHRQAAFSKLGASKETSPLLTCLSVLLPLLLLLLFEFCCYCQNIHTNRMVMHPSLPPSLLQALPFPLLHSFTS